MTRVMKMTALITIKLRFYNSKARARRLGVAFEFTFQEWVKWWEINLGKSWMNRRGRKGDQFCMCRNGDKGPYAPWNVVCKTNRENMHDTVINGTSAWGARNGRAVLTESQVRSIRRVKLLPVHPGEIGRGRAARKLTVTSLAKKYGVSRATIQFIRNGKTWGSV
jgi:hypothetical protein